MKTMKNMTKIMTINKHISLVLAVIMLLSVFAPLMQTAPILSSKTKKTILTL